MVNRFDEGGGFGFGSFKLPDFSKFQPFGQDEPFFDDSSDDKIFDNSEILKASRQDARGGTFFNALNQANLTPNMRDFFEKDQLNALNQFSARIDRVLAEGRDPAEVGTFAEFVEQPGFFQEQFRERGDQSRAAPIQRVIRRQ